ncbi:hypothetical protein FHT97_002112 [Rhizobium sp. BK399]|nr:hypothetical protein [Rhizobium sp. BK399]MCS3740114.1 hypothetical protein [Rhizobium sp. BK661]
MLAYQEKQRLSFERTDELARLFDVRPPSSEGNADAYWKSIASIFSVL